MRLPRVAIVVLALAGCATVPEDAFRVTPEMLRQRQVETRRYDGLPERDLLTAGANVLQDIGFNLENSEPRLGVLTASKQRDARDGVEIAVKVIAALLIGARIPYSKDQTIRVSVVVQPLTSSREAPPDDRHQVRVTFQRLVRMSDNSVQTETLRDPVLYQDFFDRLSKSVFLETRAP